MIESFKEQILVIGEKNEEIDRLKAQLLGIKRSVVSHRSVDKKESPV